MDVEDAHKSSSQINASDEVNVQDGVVINASGHVQELDRNFNFISILSVGIVTGNAWAAIGGSIVRTNLRTTKPNNNIAQRSSRFTMAARLVSSMASLQSHSSTG